MRYKVYISPSYLNNKYEGHNTTEKIQMCELGEYIKDILELHDINVIVADPETDNKFRCKEATDMHVNIYLSLKSNFTGSDNSQGRAKGCEIFNNPANKNSVFISECIYNELKKVTPHGDRGIKSGMTQYNGLGYYEIAKLDIPIANNIIYIDYHDNINYADWIINNKHIISTAISKGIIKYLKIEWVGDKPSDDNKPDEPGKDDQVVEVGKFLQLYSVINGYINAINAINKEEACSRVRKGKYWVYQIHKNGSVNISTNKGYPGIWVHPMDLEYAIIL